MTSVVPILFLSFQSPESDAVQAAKAGMFGVLTREVLEWHPHRVLCKRFNIPDPYPRCVGCCRCFCQSNTPFVLCTMKRGKVKYKPSPNSVSKLASEADRNRSLYQEEVIWCLGQSSVISQAYYPEIKVQNNFCRKSAVQYCLFREYMGHSCILGSTAFTTSINCTCYLSSN